MQINVRDIHANVLASVVDAAVENVQSNRDDITTMRPRPGMAIERTHAAITLQDGTAFNVPIEVETVDGHTVINRVTGTQIGNVAPEAVEALWAELAARLIMVSRSDVARELAAVVTRRLRNALADGSDEMLALTAQGSRESASLPAVRG
ncbi:hypothetical protein CKO28_18810 [Rhodovibrio sodomensis]|uniref:Uncharacterized protein n=1 Tax=Rhodovibrio sodomensis TaxID=1088 RepID=A0ABS1DHY4_9PROT|nr:hypothetical protein [Rhodovibrio sodomensis]MBK1670090.1 hypothetical protein [Rhodovibrio sodomensis]